MKSFYNYQFEKKCRNFDKDELLTAFEQNFIRTGCHHKISRKDNELELENHVLDFNYLYKLVYPWNIWTGIGKMNINIIPDSSDNSFLVKFSISRIRSILIQAFYFLVLIVVLVINYSVLVGFVLLSIYLLAMIVSIYRYFQHKRFFIKTIEHGDYYKHLLMNNYEWKSILKKKTISEIKEIINGNTLLPDIVVDMAKKELDNRSGK